MKHAASILLSGILGLVVPPYLEAKPLSVKASSTKLYGQVDQVNYALKAAGITLDADKLPAFVGNVRMGSPSYYGGISENDKVLSANIQENKLNVVFERGGKRYSLSVNTSPVNLASKVATDEKNPPLKGDLIKMPEPDKMKVVANCDVIILVDISSSMTDKIESLNKSKWDWCTEFVSSFATKSRKYFKGRGLTLVPFNAEYHISRSCNPEQVSNLFRSTTPRGNTDFGSPLKELLSEYLGSPRTRPIVIAVLTDGIPNRGPKVEQVIIDATRGMRKEGEIQITFLEIGDDYAGTSLLKYLDDFLVHDGAKYDVVDTIPFSELKNLTLEEALARAIEGEKSSGKEGGLQAEIAKLKQQIEADRAAAGKGGASKSP